MPNRVQPGGIAIQTHRGVNLGAASNTVALDIVLPPAFQIRAWGIVSAVAGVGTGTYTATLQYRGTATAAATAGTVDADAAAETEALPQAEGDVVNANTIPKVLELDLVKVGTITTGLIGDVWVIMEST